MLSSSYDKLGNDFGGSGRDPTHPSELTLCLSHEPNDRRSGNAVLPGYIRQTHGLAITSNSFM
jgi:hypothetical protein